MKTFIIATSIGLMLLASASAQSLRTEGGSDRVAPLATTDPYKVIYRVTGVFDSGGSSNTGVATSITCTNFSQSTENVTFTILNWNSVILGKISQSLSARTTQTVSTHGTNIFFDNSTFSLGIINQGSIVVSSTTTNVHCTAMIVDAASAVPNGIALHMVRFSPHPGSVE